MNNQNYHEELKMKNTSRLNNLLKEMPPFLADFFRGISEITSTRTRIAYSYDLRIFLNFLVEEVDYFANKDIENIALSDLDKVTATDIELFLEYLTYYVRYRKNAYSHYHNDESGKMRKLSSIRTLYNYYYKKQLIRTNPSLLVDTPKTRQKNIIHLETNEVSQLLDEIESGQKLSKTQKKFHFHNKRRDLAIVTLLLGTGIRISECVGLDVDHIDFDINAMQVTRKGGNNSTIYFNDEVSMALKMYLIERKAIEPKDGNKNALFLSLHRRRITDRSIQLLVKKYSGLVTKMKNITPHKLRSTYGTSLYRETNDIYLVAEVLGHVDINTTKKHYAAMSEDRRKEAAKYIRLRSDG